MKKTKQIQETSSLYQMATLLWANGYDLSTMKMTTCQADSIQNKEIKVTICISVQKR